MLKLLWLPLPLNVYQLKVKKILNHIQGSYSFELFKFHDVP